MATELNMNEQQLLILSQNSGFSLEAMNEMDRDTFLELVEGFTRPPPQNPDALNPQPQNMQVDAAEIHANCLHRSSTPNLTSK